jgi:hypothetical protein
VAEQSAATNAAVDFDLHGYVGIRLLDAEDRDRRHVVAQLGPIEATLEREPDITVRFVDRLQHGPLTYVSWQETAFDETAFYLLAGRGNISAKTRIPFENVGDRCDIVCERRQSTVPLLLAVVNMTALAKGLLPLHASAFVHDGRGVLATGWAKGGKTEALLAFMSRGARYVGDEWVYLTPDGRMFGIPEPVRLWGWQVRQLPTIAARLRRPERLRLGVLQGIANAAGTLAPRRGGGVAGSVLRRGVPMLRRQVNVQVPPARLFGAENIAQEATIDTILFMSSYDQPELHVEDIDPDELANRMAASLIHERLPLMSCYRQFRFAFPDRRSDLLERATEVELALLHKALGGRRASWLRHPYPVDIESLVAPISSCITSGRGRSEAVRAAIRP